MFRIVNTLYFTAIGWTVLIIVWKWSINAPLIAGKRRRRAMEERRSQEFENLVSTS
jgi:hypothetical protein